MDFSDTIRVTLPSSFLTEKSTDKYIIAVFSRAVSSWRRGEGDERGGGTGEVGGRRTSSERTRYNG